MKNEKWNMVDVVKDYAHFLLVTRLAFEPIQFE